LIASVFLFSEISFLHRFFFCFSSLSLLFCALIFSPSLFLRSCAFNLTCFSHLHESIRGEPQRKERREYKEKKDSLDFSLSKIEREKREEEEKNKKREEKERRIEEREGTEKSSLERRKNRKRKERKPKKKKKRENRERKRSLFSLSLSIFASARKALFWNLRNLSCRREAKRSEAKRAKMGTLLAYLISRAFSPLSTISGNLFGLHFSTLRNSRQTRALDD
jgi:hypothetical protein